MGLFTKKVLFIVFIAAFSEGGCDLLLKPPIPDPGAWYPNGPCPSGAFLKALRLKYAYKKGLTTGSKRTSIEIDPVGYSDESGLKFLEVFCANTGIFDKNALVKSVYSLDDEYSYLTCPGNTYAVAYQLLFTDKKDRYSNAESNSWYLGPHQFANNSASSLRLFCGKKGDTGFLGPQENYGPRTLNFVSCGRSLVNESDYGIMCKLVTNRQRWHTTAAREREMTWQGSFDQGCCSTDDFICSGGLTGFTEVKQCNNVNTKSREPLACTFDRRVGVKYQEEPNRRGQTPEEDVYLKSLDIKEQQKMGLTIYNVGPNIIKNFEYRQGFNTSILQVTLSALSYQGSVSFTVPPGQSSTVQQLYGSCGIYQMNTDVFNVVTRNDMGAVVGTFEDAYPLKPRVS